ncbi:hypothetical protein AB3M80_14290 [Arthrospira platensis BEA 1257B]
MDETKSTFEELKDSFEQLTEAINQAMETTIGVFETLGDAISDLEERVTTNQEETEGNFEGLVTEISDNHRDSLESLLGNFSQFLAQDKLSEITDDFSNFKGVLTDVYNTLGSQAAAVADNLQERGSAIFENVKDYAEDSLKDNLEDSFKDAIDDVVSDMIQEVGENMVMMKVGATVTSSLTPILPQIVAAKVATGTIKQVLSLGGILS